MSKLIQVEAPGVTMSISNKSSTNFGSSAVSTSTSTTTNSNLADEPLQTKSHLSVTGKNYFLSKFDKRF